MEPDRPELFCPRDASPLAVREWGPSWFGSCGRCHGVWIRPEELHRFSQQLASPPASYPEGEIEVLEDTALCSCAGQPLMNRVVRDAVSIDVCPSCRAIWFDPGELQCLLAAQRAATLAGRGPVPGGASGPREARPEGSGSVVEEIAWLVFDLFGTIIDL